MRMRRWVMTIPWLSHRSRTETGAVGVVAEDRAVISDSEGIYGPGVRRACGEIVGDIDRRDLVGQRDVEARPPCRKNSRTRSWNSSGAKSYRR
jgi:hypothetical protein